MSAAPWIAAYVTALVLWLVVMATARQPTLWKGRSLAYFNGAIAVALLVLALARQEEPSWGIYAFGGFLLASAIGARNAWLLLHVDRASIDQILEKCFAQTRASHNRTQAGYRVSAGGAEMSVSLTPMLGVHALRLGGNTDSKKAQLIRSLIAKQFRPSVPALRIHT